MILLTQDSTPIIGWVAKLLGYILNFYGNRFYRTSEYRTGDYPFYDCSKSSDVASYHKAAEIFKASGEDESGAAGNSGKVQRKKRQ